MSTAKDKIKSKIQKRIGKNREYKHKAAQRLGPSGIVLQFIEAIEKLKLEAKGSLDFQESLYKNAGLLHQRMLAIDPEVSIDIVWNNESNIENWEELQVDGVLIKWSKWYLGKNPFSDAEKYIDVAGLFLEGYLL